MADAERKALGTGKCKFASRCFFSGVPELPKMWKHLLHFHWVPNGLTFCTIHHARITMLRVHVLRSNAARASGGSTFSVAAAAAVALLLLLVSFG